MLQEINFYQRTRCVLLLAPNLHVIIINLKQKLHYVVNLHALWTKQIQVGLVQFYDEL